MIILCISTPTYPSIGQNIDGSTVMWKGPNGKCLSKPHRCNGVPNECTIQGGQIDNSDEEGCKSNSLK